MSDFDEMNLGPRWYVAHTYSGYENKVKTNLEKIIENRNLGHLIYEIRIPTETVIETTDAGTEKETEQKLLPGYVFIKMTMTDEELAIMQGGEAHRENTFKVGDMIKIVRGSFEGFSGKIYDVSEDGASVTVLVNTGKRDMPVKIDVGDIKLAD